MSERTDPAEKAKDRKYDLAFAAAMFAISILFVLVIAFMIWRKKKRAKEINMADYFILGLMIFQCGVLGFMFFTKYFPNGPPV